MSAPLDVGDADLAAWRQASALTTLAVEGVTMSADALLLLAAQCVASASLALDDIGLALERTAHLSVAMRHRLDGPPPTPIRILAIEEDTP